MSQGIAVLALGGNAIASRSRTFDSQYGAIRHATKHIASLAKNGYKIVITHGNGPQVGDALLRNEFAKNIVPSLPLHACVAETQGMMGAMIETALLENLGRNFKVASLITKVVTSSNDPAFKNPTKPIGPIFTKADLNSIKKLEPLASFREIMPGKFRRVVASPDPISVVEIDAVKKLIENGYIVIACGGGGIPITIGKKISFTDAVIDKDLASERLATGIGASVFASLTDVDGVYLNFRSKNKKLLKKIRVEKMRSLLEKGSFGIGNMEPKVRAAIRFAENTGRPAVIAHLEKARKVVDLKSGTIIYK